jgi:hypothetical protein
MHEQMKTQRKDLENQLTRSHGVITDLVISAQNNQPRSNQQSTQSHLNRFRYSLSGLHSPTLVNTPTTTTPTQAHDDFGLNYYSSSTSTFQTANPGTFLDFIDGFDDPLPNPSHRVLSSVNPQPVGSLLLARQPLPPISPHKHRPCLSETAVLPSPPRPSQSRTKPTPQKLNPENLRSPAKTPSNSRSQATSHP